MAVATCSLGACGAGPSPDSLPGSDEPARWVRKVVIEGNREVDRDDLLAGMATQPPRGWPRRQRTALDRIELERDRARIVAYYQRRGFYAARVREVQVREIAQDRADVVFVVEEGAVAVLRDVVIDGAPEAGPDAPRPAGRPAGHRAALLARLGLRPGQPFRYDDYEVGKQRVIDSLLAAGYARARVRGSAEVDRRAHDVVVRVVIDAGQRVRFGDVAITGLDKIPATAIHDRIAWKSGEVFDPRAVATTRQRLLQTRWFRTVRVELAGQERGAVQDLRITAIESPPREIRLGLGLGVDPARWEFRGQAGYQRRGFLSPLTTLRAEVRPAYALIRATGGSEDGLVGETTVSLTRDDLWTALLRGQASVAYTLEEYEAYASQGPRLRLGLVRPWLDSRLRVGVSWNLQILGFLQVRDAIDPTTRDDLGLTGTYRLGTFEQTLTFDQRDNPFDSRRGLYAELRLEQSGAFSFSEFSFSAAVAELRGYLSPASRLVVAGRLRHGRRITGDRLPITRRFFAGGASSHRGFAHRRLSPTVGSDPDVVAIGGEVSLELGLEARLDVLRLYGEWLGVTAFIDGGDVTRATAELALGDIPGVHWAAGLGLRYGTPVGPIRFDLGYRLNRHGSGEPEPGERLAFHFGIGEAF